MTALYAVYDANQSMRIARAGHPLPMVYRSDEKKAIELPCQGVYPLGIESYDLQIPVTETKLNQGDRFLVYTDGLTERFNMAEEAYGEKRLLRLLATDSDDTNGGVLTAIIGDVDRFAGERPADDDQALLLGIVE